MSSTAAAEPEKSPQRSSGYDVARPGGKCSVSGRVIEPKEAYFAALRETPIGFERLDISHENWPDFDRGNIVGFWQAVMPLHEEKKKVFVDDGVLCELFERLASVTETAKLNFRFVLGLILMRKRLLIYETSRTDVDGREIWSMRFKGREDSLDLLDPKLDESQMKEVSTQLGEILNESL